MSRAAQFAVFFAAAVVVLTLVHSYLWFRLVRDTALAPPWRQAATAAIVALALSVPAWFALNHLVSSEIMRGPGAAPFVWMGAMVLLVFWFGAADLLRLAAFVAGKIAGFALAPERRLLLARATALAGVAVVAALTAIALWNGARDPVVTEVAARVPRLPRSLDGFSIAQLSDLHLGGSRADRAWAERVVARTNALAPDLIAVTGDLVDAPPERIRADVAPLAGLRAPRGVFFVTGNHEIYTGLGEWLPEIRGLGWRVLRNERVAIGEGGAVFDLAGLDDGGHGAGGGPDLERALAGRDPARALVVLAHQPKTADAAAARGAGLVLSGHTHGGQIWPFSALVRLQQPYLRGAYPLAGGATLYVTDGTGTWGPPMRLGTRNEIVRIVLRPGS